MAGCAVRRTVTVCRGSGLAISGSRKFASQTAGIEAETRELIPAIDSYRFVDEVPLDHSCNWKVTAENFMECYHCLGVHGNALFARLAIDTYRIGIHETTMTHLCEPRPELCSGDGRDPMKEDDAFAAWCIWPTFALNRQPGGFVRVGIFEPLSVDRAIYRYRYFSTGATPDAGITSDMHSHAELTGTEDARLVAGVQKGLGNRGYQPGILNADDTDHGEREHGVRHFQSMVLDMSAKPT